MHIGSVCTVVDTSEGRRIIASERCMIPLKLPVMMGHTTLW